jgi:hypothetical protein
MQILYSSTGKAMYDCSHTRSDHTNTPGCRSIIAAVVDVAVAQRILAVVTPTEIAVALAAADEVVDRRARSTRALELRVERARYDAARAERAFHHCEPENRLVARTLEHRWEDMLKGLTEAEAALAAAQAAATPLPPRADLEALAADLPSLWHASTTSPKDRTGRSFDVAAMRWLRFAHRIASPSLPTLAPGERTVADVAARLGITESAVYYWLAEGQLQARRDDRGRWCVPFSADVEKTCRQRVLTSAHIKRRTQTSTVGGAV